MAHDGLQVLNGLGGEDVLEIEALNCQRSMDNLSRHVALDLGFAETDLEDEFHEVVTLFLGEGSGHQRVFYRLHDGVIQTIPSIVPGNVLGADCIRPPDCFGKQKLELVGLISIGLDHGAQEFPGFSDFQSRDGGGVWSGPQGKVRSPGVSD